jgi:hypothetical protein
MPATIKIALSLVVLGAGAGVHQFEGSLGNGDLTSIAAALAAFMVLSVWIFPETAD